MAKEKAIEIYERAKGLDIDHNFSPHYQNGWHDGKDSVLGLFKQALAELARQDDKIASERVRNLETLLQYKQKIRMLQTELAEQPETHPEKCCSKCGGRNIVWYVSNELWNTVVEEREQIICPICFVEMAEKKGIKPTAWRLSQETEQPVCETCGDSETVVNPTFGPDDPSQPPYLPCPDCKQPEAGESEALLNVLKIYAETDEPVSQQFYQGLCLKAKKYIDQQVKRIEQLEVSLKIAVDYVKNPNSRRTLEGQLKDIETGHY